MTPAEATKPGLPPWLECLLLALLVCGFYWNHFDIGRMQSGGDFANLFWPGKVHLARAMGEGVVALWNPYSYLGAPFAASMQHGVFYPVDWVLFALLPATAGLNAYLLLHLVWCALGVRWLLRAMAPLPSSIVVTIAAAYPCTGWFWGHQEHINQVACVAWMPWLAALAWRAGTRRIDGLRFVALYAGAAAMQFLAGHPQAAAYSHLLAGAILLAWAIRMGAEPLRERLAPLLRWVAACALFVLIGAVQLLPTLELNKLSYRQFKDPLYAHSFSMPPDALQLLWSPGAFGNYAEGYRRLPDGSRDRRAYNEYGIHTGVPILALAVLALAVSPRRRAAWFLAGLAVLALLLALGGNTDPRRIASGDFSEFTAPGWSLLDAFLLVFPPAQGFRVPARTVVVFLLCLLLLAALGWSALAARMGARWSHAFCLVVAAGILALLYVPSRHEKFRDPVPLSPLLSCVTATPPAEPTLDDRVFRLVVSDADLLIAERERDTTHANGNPLSLRWQLLQPGMHIVAGLPMEDGYEEGLVPPVRTKDFLFAFNRHFRQRRPDPQFLALLGIGRVLTPMEIDTATFAPLTALGVFAPLFRNPLHRGAAFWKAEARGIDFAALEGPFQRTGLLQAARETRLLDYGQAPAWGTGPRLRTRLVGPNAVEVLHDTRAGAPPSDAVLAMAYYPGWELADGASEPTWISAAHVVVPQSALSDGRALLVYRPVAYRFGLFLTAVGLALLAGLWMLRGRDQAAGSP